MLAKRHCSSAPADTITQPVPSSQADDLTHLTSVVARILVG
jgi:hypothetical protein